MEFISPGAALCQIKRIPSVTAWEKVSRSASPPCLTLNTSFLASRSFGGDLQGLSAQPELPLCFL